MHITLASHGVAITLDSASELDVALDALARAVARIQAFGPSTPPTPSKARPALNAEGMAVVDYLSKTPGATFAGTLAAGHAKKTVDWLCKKNYLSFDSKTQLLTVA